VKIQTSTGVKNFEYLWIKQINLSDKNFSLFFVRVRNYFIIKLKVIYVKYSKKYYILQYNIFEFYENNKQIDQSKEKNE